MAGKKKEDAVEETARIRLSYGATINTGNYNSARVDYEITRNCADNPKAIESMRKEISTEIKKRLKAEIQEIQSHVGEYTGL